MLCENNALKFNLTVLENGQDVTKDHISSGAETFPAFALCQALARQELFRSYAKLTVDISDVEIKDQTLYKQEYNLLANPLDSATPRENRKAFAMIDAKVAEQTKTRSSLDSLIAAAGEPTDGAADSKQRSDRENR